MPTFVADPSDPSTFNQWTLADLSAPRPSAESLLSPADVAGYQALGVYFYPQTQGTMAGWTYTPYGPVYATKLAAFYTNRYGSPMPSPDDCPIATAIYRFSDIWVWWIGRDQPPAGSPVLSATWRTIPETRVCNNAQVTDIFPALAEPPATSVDFTDTPEYLSAQQETLAQQEEVARLASGGAPRYQIGDTIIEGGMFKEYQADGTWKTIGTAPTATGTINAPISADSSLPTLGPNDGGVTGVPVSLLSPTIAMTPAIVATPTTATDTTPPNPLLALASLKWIMLVVGGIVLLAAAVSARRK